MELLRVDSKDDLDALDVHHLSSFDALRQCESLGFELCVPLLEVCAVLTAVHLLSNSDMFNHLGGIVDDNRSASRLLRTL